MKKNRRFLAISGALVGCIGIALYFLIASSSRTAALIKQEVSKDEILQRAEASFQMSELAQSELSRKVSLHLNKSLMTFAQTHLDDQLPRGFFPIGSWVVTWQGQVETKKEGTKDVEYELEYDFKGHLISLREDADYLNRPPNYKESEAIRAAEKFMQGLGVDTTAMVLNNKTINTDDRVNVYNFSFLKPSPISPQLKETYEITISGERTTSYKASITFDMDETLLPDRYETSKIVSLILVLLTWGIISILLLIKFFSKLRHDELEFKYAKWLAGIVFAMMWGLIALQGWPELEAVLLAGALVGALTGITILVILTVTDSVNRDVWAERLALRDVLFRGFLRVREMGYALLDSLFVSGLVLFTFGVIYWVVGNVGFAHLEFEDEVLWVFNGDAAFVSALLKNLLGALFIVTLLFSFSLSYLREKIEKPLLLIALFAFFINTAGLYLYYVQPTFVAFVLFLPLSVVIAFLALRVDYLAIFIATFLINSFLELIFVGHLPGTFLHLPVVFYGGLVLLILGGGWVLAHSKRELKDFEDYVPEYASRIAERERFLKELEIARNLQRRFLPQNVPCFPNLEIACICRPAMEVGGDYYDFVLNGGNSLSIVIGDVSGKGVSAAFYMTMAKGILKTLTKAAYTPKRILSEMNTIFYENVPKDVFISVIYGEFEIDRQVLRFARAGHNPLIVSRRSGTTEPILPRGLAIGLDSGQVFTRTIEEIEIPFHEGDVFVFYTDGISEACNKHGEEFGEERLRDLIQKNREQSAQEILNKITSEVSRFSGNTPQHDDLTMVVVKAGEVGLA